MPAINPGGIGADQQERSFSVSEIDKDTITFFRARAKPRPGICSIP
jgi:hypothetical protein